MQTECKDQDGILVLTLKEPIVDINNISEFRDLLEERASESQRAFVLDLSETSYIGSVGLGMISLISIMLQKEDKGFGVVVTTDETRRVFEISGLKKVMHVFDSVEAAVEGLGGE